MRTKFDWNLHTVTEVKRPKSKLEVNFPDAIKRTSRTNLRRSQGL